MNIYIDYTTVEELERDIGAYTGAGNYTRDLIRTLKEAGTDIKLLVHEDFVPKKSCERELMPEEDALFRVKDITAFSFSKGDVLVLPAVTGRILAKALRIRKKHPSLRIYAVIHDRQHNISRFDPMDRLFQEGILRFLPLLFARYVLKKVSYDLLYPGWIKAVDKVFTVSDHTLQALSHKNLRRVILLYQPSSMARISDLKNPGLDGKEEFILFVSGGRPEKNLGRALLAFRDFCKSTKTKCRLCVTGIERKRLYYIADRLGLSGEFTDERVRSFDYVEREELAYLYRNCRYLLFVSKGEGFGLPVLEAVESGKTVLCSWQSAMPEVCGSILYYVDAFNVSSIRDGMVYLNDDENLAGRERLVEKKKRIIAEQTELDREVLVKEMIGE